MRNHKKIKAIRTKFGIAGYGVWSMLLEYLTGNDGNVFEYSDIEFELIAGDFGVSVTEIRDTVDYCIRLELLFNENGFIRSESLDERLAPVYDKRGAARSLSKQQLRKNGKFATNNTDTPVVSATETPQSKVNKIEYSYIDFVQTINTIGSRKFRKDAKSERQFDARVKDGFTKENFIAAITNAYKDQFHIGNKFMYLTPEFFTRSDKLNTFMNRPQEFVKPELTIEQKEYNKNFFGDTAPPTNEYGV